MKRLALAAVVLALVACSKADEATTDTTTVMAPPAVTATMPDSAAMADTMKMADTTKPPTP